MIFMSFESQYASSYQWSIERYRPYLASFSHNSLQVIQSQWFPSDTSKARGEFKLPQTPRHWGLGPPPSLKNTKYTRMRHRKNSEIFSPEGPRENVSPRPDVALNVPDFRLICKGVHVRHLLLVINSNLGHISHHFWHMASFPLKTHILPALSLSHSTSVTDRWTDRRTTTMTIARPLSLLKYGWLNIVPPKACLTLESSHSPQVPPPRQSYSPGGVTIFALPAVPLCPL